MAYGLWLMAKSFRLKALDLKLKVSLEKRIYADDSKKSSADIFLWKNVNLH
jgi:hypothetical protein